MCELVGNVKNYEWGKLGEDSMVAKLLMGANVEFNPVADMPYAELWMGDHPSGMSELKGSGLTLEYYISSNLEDNTGGKPKLTFLLKVLSIRKALSIQVHPNKKEAERLHAERPDVYKDDNHKPELAIAITPFVALCGFRQTKEIHRLISDHVELIDLIGKETLNGLLKKGTAGLKECYSKVLRSPPEAINACIEKLDAKFSALAKKTELSKWFVQLNQDFPNDVGTLSLFFFNIITLSPGEAIFLEAKLPHAYLSGDCVECMACSDNVVRAGLTPKYKDVDTLLELLNYEGKSPADLLFKSEKLTGAQKFTELFLPPVEDFAVAKLAVSKELITAGNKKHTLKISPFGSIIFVLSGYAVIAALDMMATRIDKGSIMFIPSNAGSDLRITILDDSYDFVLFHAFFNDF